MSKSSISWRHWCPNGCGKRVIYDKVFVCGICGDVWDKRVDLYKAIEGVE